MGDTVLRTSALPFVQAFKVNKAPATLATLAPTTTEPNSKNTGYEGTIILDTTNDTPFNFAKFLFFGAGVATGTFGVEIVAWHFWPTGSTGEWVPTVLANLTCTLGSTPSALVATDLFVSSIMVNSSTANYELIPTSSNCPIQMLKLDLAGAQRIQILPGPVGTGTVTNINALVSGF